MAAWALAILLCAPDLQGTLQRELERSGISRSGLSVLVGRAGQDPCFAVAPDEPRVPASNQKLVTAAAALWLLGPDFHFQTRLARGPGGELVVIGDGDPNLSGRWFDGDPAVVMRGLARELADKGHRRFEGGLVLDATRFDDVIVHPEWPQDQLDRWYCAPVAALVYNDSCWDVTVLPGGRAGLPALVQVQPSLIEPRLENSCSTISERGRHVVHVGRSSDGDLEVRGAILLSSAGITGNVAVRDPVSFFGRAFRAALRAEGVEVRGGMRTGQIPDAVPLTVLRSDLERTLRVMLTRSQNLYAECVFKRLGEGSFESAGAAALRVLAEHGIATDGLEVRDGSGLARGNRVTARALFGILQALRGEPRFERALATGGEGTLRRRYRDLGERVRAKTGTIRGVRTLSGYVEGRSGGRYVFVVLSNGRSAGRARALQDRIVLALARAP